MQSHKMVPHQKVSACTMYYQLALASAYCTLLLTKMISNQTPSARQSKARTSLAKPEVDMLVEQRELS
jgi:hypothetical protein